MISTPNCYYTESYGIWNSRLKCQLCNIMTLQISLCGTGQDLFKDAMQEGKLSEGTPLKVGYDDVFSSPWCCDSSHEDRYETLISQIHQLDLDSTVVVLLSVMCLFDSEQVDDLSAKSTIISHGRKFSLLLQRWGQRTQLLMNNKPIFYSVQLD